MNLVELKQTSSKVSLSPFLVKNLIFNEPEKCDFSYRDSSRIIAQVIKNKNTCIEVTDKKIGSDIP